MLRQSFTDFIFDTNTDGSGNAASYVRALAMLGPIQAKHCPKPIVYGTSDLKEAGELSKAIDACIKRNFGSEENMLRRETEIKKIWFSRVKKWLDRDYFESGCEGGMFPLHEWKPGDKDQKTVSLWYQMNTWLNEHLDDEERFVVEKGA